MTIPALFSKPISALKRNDSWTSEEGENHSMTSTVDNAATLSVSDGVAIVAGAAVASVHLRGVINERFIGPGWLLVWATFGWVALSSTGPFLFLIRKLFRKDRVRLKIGEKLWLMLGLPWLAAALLQRGGNPTGQLASELVATVLSIGLGIVSLISIAVLWETWVKVSPRKAEETFSGPLSNRVGLVLAIAWPVQCGAGMVVIG